MLEGKRIAFLIEEGFEDSELQEPLRVMNDFGAKSTVIGSGTSNTYKSKKGIFEITVDASIDNVDVNDFDAIIIPGGYAPDKMRSNQLMIDFVKNACTANKVIAAICHGPQLLISADIVKGRYVTSWHSITVDLKNAGARWTDKPVVIDGNLITARSVADIPRFNEAIVNALINKK